MSQFRFRLQKILDLRAEAEKGEALRLAEARRSQSEAEAAREHLEAVRNAGRSRVTQVHGQGGSVGYLQNLEYLMGHLEEQLHSARTVCRERQEKVDESVESYRAAMRDRQTLDQLREKRRTAWLQNQARKEQKDLDELAVIRHARAQNGPPVG